MIAVVVPTCRPDLYKKTFLPAWRDLFTKHDVALLTVFDHADKEKIVLDVRTKDETCSVGIKDVMGKNIDLIYNRNASIKNVGFFYIATQMPEVEYIISLDDDVEPVGDSIQDHIDILNTRAPISWMAVGDTYTRGFPYDVREEAEVVVSHGVWDNVPDLDAPTQLVRGGHPMKFFKQPIPKGIYFPFCEMNIAFKRKVLPYMYLSPQDVERGIERCDDIFCGINVKRKIDEHGWAAVTGYSTVYHTRASNVWSNLKKEAFFIELNETYWSGDESDPFFDIYNEKMKRWEALCQESA